MREITSHRTNSANAELKIVVKDKNGAGGAPHLYEISGFDVSENRPVRWMKIQMRIWAR